MLLLDYLKELFVIFGNQIKLKIAPKNLQMIIMWCITSSQEGFKATKILSALFVSVTAYYMCTYFLIVIFHQN